MLPAATVLLRHERREDTHLDWMIDLPGFGDAEAGAPRPMLTTFRCADAWPDWQRLGRVGLTALAPHRRAWLDRQGAVSGGRGRALRLGRGTVWVQTTHQHGWEMRLAWPAGPVVPAGEVRGRVIRLHEGRWEFVAAPARPAGAAGVGILGHFAGTAR